MGLPLPTAFAAVARLCVGLAATSKRLEKRRLIAEFLRSLDREEVAPAVLLLAGKILPETEQRGLGLGGAAVSRALEGPLQKTLEVEPLSLMAVSRTFDMIVGTTGKDSVARKGRLLETLLGRARPEDREWLVRGLFGEMRIGVVEGVLLEAIAEAGAIPAEVVRNANMLAGDLGAVAAAAMSGGEAALAGMSLRLFTPVKPMLADVADDAASILEQHGGTTAVEWKFDGARIQIHRQGAVVRIYSRRLTEVTVSLPEITEIALGLSAESLLLEGEVVALDPQGRPLPFQDLMRRFRRVHDVETMRREMPLTLYLFDLLHRDGRSLLSRPYAERWRELAGLVPARLLAPRKVMTAPEEIEAEFREAVAAGHEGIMAKALDSDYATGKRGKKWFKLKPAETLDCVITAAEWGHGRRQGTLSNYHLAVRDGDGWQMIGKTFKGLTDVERVSMTERLLTMKTEEHGGWVEVRPEIVVEVVHNEIQKSSTYPSGFALRFARIVRVREDKGPEQAETYARLKALYEGQFAVRGRFLP